MKISKETLRRIIKEEIDKTLAEKFVTDVPRSIERNRTEDDLSPEQKEQLAYLLAKRGETLSTDIAKRNRQINYFIDLISSRGKLGLDITPDYIDDKDDIPAIAESLIGILNLIKG